MDFSQIFIHGDFVYREYLWRLVTREECVSVCKQTIDNHTSFTRTSDQIGHPKYAN